ncbi:MAG TPA: ATP synthase subunit A, partial [Cyanothece sp. UBA12306]|nr:ATP synthase subunit A [Cyanothece sp. UBA12306]
HSPFFILHSSFFILHSSFFILHSSFFILGLQNSFGSYTSFFALCLR